MCLPLYTIQHKTFSQFLQSGQKFSTLLAVRTTIVLNAIRVDKTLKMWKNNLISCLLFQLVRTEKNVLLFVHSLVNSKTFHVYMHQIQMDAKLGDIAHQEKVKKNPFPCLPLSICLAAETSLICSEIFQVFLADHGKKSEKQQK